MFRIWISVFLCVTGGVAASAYGQEAIGCGTLQNAYGPYDYTNPVDRRDRLPLVEKGHFDGGVEALRGHASHPNTLAGDLDYTLRAFPNHHRALYSTARYHLSRKDVRRPPMRHSVECYFERATRFAPHDGTVRLIHGIYLYKTGNTQDAVGKFRQALDLSPDSAEVHYNIGLVYVELDELAQAKVHAERAYELGHPLAGLRNKLKRRGAW